MILSSKHIIIFLILIYASFLWLQLLVWPEVAHSWLCCFLEVAHWLKCWYTCLNVPQITYFVGTGRVLLGERCWHCTWPCRVLLRSEYLISPALLLLSCPWALWPIHCSYFIFWKGHTQWSSTLCIELLLMVLEKPYVLLRHQAQPCLSGLQHP